MDESETYWRYVLLLEMLTRVIKQIIRGKLRDMSRDLRQPYKQVVIDELNLIFGKRKISQYHWKLALKEAIKKKFVKALSPK